MNLKKDYGFITAITNNTSAFINYDGVTCSWSSFFIGGLKTIHYFLVC